MRVRTCADADYMLSDARRRREYDAMRPTSTPQPQQDDASTQSESARFYESQHTGQPEPQHMFADVWAALLRPEVEQPSTWRGLRRAPVAGGRHDERRGDGLYPRQHPRWYVGRLTPALGGAVLGNRLGAIRDAKGKAVSEVFLALPGRERAEILRVLAMKVLGSM